MKNYILTSLAVIIAIGLSAFTTTEKQGPEKPLTNYVWFNVNTGNGDLSSLTDSDVTFNSSLSAAPSTNPGCNGGMKNCVVGFNADQIDATGQHLKPGEQDIQFTYYQRSSN